MSVMARIRPPRKPARARPFALFRIAAYVVASIVLGLLLLKLATWAAVQHAAQPSGAPWEIELANSSGLAIDRATFKASPASRRAVAVAEESVHGTPNGFSGSVSFVVYRACDVRVVLELGGTEYVFDKVVRIGPRHDSWARVEVTPGPLVNGFEPIEIRSVGSE